MTLTGISSIATRQLLADLACSYQQQTGVTVAITSVGGVDAVQRLQTGAAFDVVFLAAVTIDKLITSGHVQADSRVDLVQSPVAVAVRAGAPVPDIASEDAVKQAVLAAPSISVSTGPSGVFLNQLFARWGIAEQVAPRLVQAPPGVPVGSLVARGDVALGVQQGSERMTLPGSTVVGTLPAAIACITTFSAGLGLACSQPDAVRAMLAFMTSTACAATIRRHGMEPAPTRT